MFRKFGIAAVAALMLTTPACDRTPTARVEAGTVQTLLVAAWSDDEASFETVVDRPAVRADLRQQLLRVAQANMLSVEGGASDAALDRMITPHAFRLVDDRTGGPLATAPSREQTAALLKAVGKNRVCLHDQSSEQACLLTFAKVKSGWRLVGMAPAGFTIAVGPEPEKTRS